jgi:hypothetical protein
MIGHWSPLAQVLCALISASVLVFALDRVFLRSWRRQMEEGRRRSASRLSANKLLARNPRASAAASYARTWL